MMCLEDDPAHHLKRAINFHREIIKEELPNLNYKKKSKINIGYFSSDFNRHAVSFLLTKVFELHDQSHFNIYAYSLSKQDDDYTKRIRDAVYCFREVSDLGDLEIVDLARNDQLDIAIDLNGYTLNNRASIFSYRVAPIQINYLGYPGTLGSKSYDYILADKVLIPEENQKFYMEKVLYLPYTCEPYDNTKYISNREFTREELGLPLDGFIFTCFNRIEKITRTEFQIWMRLLQKIDTSVLWILKPHEAAIKNIFNEVEKYGIDKERIIFAEKMGLDDHISRHYCGDLFLDTFNYNAATTASIALSCGLPIITLLGKSFSARIAASILSACDLNELITHSQLEYEELAYELATNDEKLSGIREKIRNKKDSSYFDTNQFTKGLENIYRNIVPK